MDPKIYNMDQVQAMFFLAVSWLNIKPKTIKNCWDHTNILSLLSNESDEIVLDSPTSALPLENEVIHELDGLLGHLPGNENNEIPSVEDLDLESGEADMMLFPEFEFESNDDSDIEEENVLIEEEPTPLEIAEQKRILRESFENILQYDTAMSEFDILVHRRIRAKLAESRAEFNNSKKQTDLRSFYKK